VILCLLLPLYFTGAGLEAYCHKLVQLITSFRVSARPQATGWYSSWSERKWPIIQSFLAEQSQP